MFKDFNFEFHNPWFLLLFLGLIPVIIRDLTKKKKKGIKVPTITNMTRNKSFLFVLFLLKFTKYIILSALIIAMARPRTFTVSQERDDNKGVDIILAIDVSLSMLARDLVPDRMEALKEIATKFVTQRPNDRIGVVTYSGEAMSKVPVTLDHNVVVEELKTLNPLELDPGTSIGDGLAVAVSHLKDSKAKSKIIILMTDGVNTIQNGMPSMVAAELAQSNNIKVYTIGIGTNGYALMPTNIDIFGDFIFTETKVSIDEGLLRNISEMTDGQYYRATSNESLQNIYDQINQLEKTELKANILYNYDEYFRLFLWIAFFTLLIDAFARWILFKTIL